MPSECVFTHAAQDMAYSWVGVVSGQSTQILELFWALFWEFLGHIVKFQGTKGLFDMRKPSRIWNVSTVFQWFSLVQDTRAKMEKMARHNLTHG